MTFRPLSVLKSLIKLSQDIFVLKRGQKYSASLTILIPVSINT